MQLMAIVSWFLTISVVVIQVQTLAINLEELPSSKAVIPEKLEEEKIDSSNGHNVKQRSILESLCSDPGPPCGRTTPAPPPPPPAYYYKSSASILNKQSTSHKTETYYGAPPPPRVGRSSVYSLQESLANQAASQRDRSEIVATGLPAGPLVPGHPGSSFISRQEHEARQASSQRDLRINSQVGVSPPRTCGSPQVKPAEPATLPFLPPSLGMPIEPIYLPGLVSSNYPSMVGLPPVQPPPGNFPVNLLPPPKTVIPTPFPNSTFPDWHKSAQESSQKDRSQYVYVGRPSEPSLYRPAVYPSDYSYQSHESAKEASQKDKSQYVYIGQPSQPSVYPPSQPSVYPPISYPGDYSYRSHESAKEASQRDRSQNVYIGQPAYGVPGPSILPDYPYNYASAESSKASSEQERSRYVSVNAPHALSSVPNPVYSYQAAESEASRAESERRKSEIIRLNASG